MEGKKVKFMTLFYSWRQQRAALVNRPGNALMCIEPGKEYPTSQMSHAGTGRNCEGTCWDMGEELEGAGAQICWINLEEIRFGRFCHS